MQCVGVLFDRLGSKVGKFACVTVVEVAGRGQVAPVDASTEYH